jgi:hypothetical protein
MYPDMHTQIYSPPVIERKVATEEVYSLNVVAMDVTVASTVFVVRGAVTLR